MTDLSKDLEQRILALQAAVFGGPLPPIVVERSRTAREALLTAICAEVRQAGEATVCPYVRQSDEGTAYCALAQGVPSVSPAGEDQREPASLGEAPGARELLERCQPFILYKVGTKPGPGSRALLADIDAYLAAPAPVLPAPGYACGECGLPVPERLVKRRANIVSCANAECSRFESWYEVSVGAPPVLPAEGLREAAERMLAREEASGFSSALLPLHDYREGVHQPDCDYCALRAALRGASGAPKEKGSHDGIA